MIAPLPLASVVVPVLDEEAALPGLLDALAELPGRWEVVVADGGSADATRQIATGRALLVDAPRGRARQLNAGAAAASGDVLVFLHADSRLPPNAYRELCGALRDPAVRGGNFVLRFDGGDRFSALLTAWYRLQRRFGIYYGDSTLWMRRSAFDALGGFRELEIMEDYELVRRLERLGATSCLPGPALTSARRWQRAGVGRTVLSWVVIRWLWLAGVPAARLAVLYGHIR